MRGKDTSVICDQCGRKVPRGKAVAYERGVSFNTELHTNDDRSFFERKRVYYCISCAKHRGIFEKLRKQAERERRKEMGL